jgi:hypothetical protein
VKLGKFTHTLLPSSAESTAFFYEHSKVLKKGRDGLDSERYRRHREAAGEYHFESLRDLLRYDASGIALSTTHSVDTEPSAWVLKTVGRRPLPILHTFRALFLGAKIVLLTRNPLMVTRSVFTDRRRRDIRLSCKELFKHVFDPVFVLREQSMLFEEDNVFPLAYEHLVGGNLEGEMRDLCDFLRIPFDPCCLQPTVCGKEAVVQTSSQQTKKVFHQERDWRDDLTLREQCAVVIGHLLLRVYFIIRRWEWPAYDRVLAEMNSAHEQKD